MKSLLFILALTSLILTSCSDSSDPNVDPEALVRLYAQTNDEYVGITSKSTDGIASSDIDSIIVTSARVLVSRIMLHMDSNTEEDNQLFKEGPFVLDYFQKTVTYFSEAMIPDTTYDKIKFEIHRFSASDLDKYEDNIVFADFATPDRWTVIIEGNMFKGNQSTGFVYNSNIVENITVKFDKLMTIPYDVTTNINIELDLNNLFHDGEKILDPTDESDKKEIEKNLKDAFKAYKFIIQ
jgi:hypothetical protein